MASNADTHVQSFIDDAMKKAQTNWPKNTSIINVTNSAWDDLLKQRKAHDQDEELAAAEHYMYARYMVGKGGESSYFGMMAFVAGYDGVKMLLQGLGAVTGAGDHMLNVLSTDGTKPTSASVLSVRWGRYGCSDGLKDFANK